MKRWFLIYCKRHEQKRAYQNLTNQKVECFYPKILVSSFSDGKAKKSEMPICPSYMFVRFDDEHGKMFSAIRSTRGVVDFIRFGSYPKEVPVALILALKNICSHEGASIEGENEGMEKHGLYSYCDKLGALVKENNVEHREMMFVRMLSESRF